MTCSYHYCIFAARFMEIIEFEFLGFELQEPMSVVTNSLITITCLFIFLKLIKDKRDDEFTHYWSLFFLTLGLSTFAGGLSHLFFKYTGFYGKIPVFSMAIIANFFLDRACFTLIHDKAKTRMIEYLLLAKTILSILLLVVLVEFIGKKIFLIVQFNTVITAAGILVWFCAKTKAVSEAWKYYTIGIIILLITAGVQIAKLNLHLWFNKDDFSHVLIALAMIFFYKGVLKYREA